MSDSDFAFCSNCQKITMTMGPACIRCGTIRVPPGPTDEYVRIRRSTVRLLQSAINDALAFDEEVAMKTDYRNDIARGPKELLERAENALGEDINGQ